MCYPKQKISLPWSKKYVIGRRQLPQRQTKSYQETEINIKVMFQLFHVCMTYLINIHKFCLLEIVHMSYYSSKQFEKTHMSNIFPIILLILSLSLCTGFILKNMYSVEKMMQDCQKHGKVSLYTYLSGISNFLSKRCNSQSFPNNINS